MSAVGGEGAGSQKSRRTPRGEGSLAMKRLLQFGVVAFLASIMVFGSAAKDPSRYAEGSPETSLAGIALGAADIPSLLKRFGPPIRKPDLGPNGEGTEAGDCLFIWTSADGSLELQTEVSFPKGGVRSDYAWRIRYEGTHGSPDTATGRGASLGDSRERIVQLYGQPTKQNPKEMTYIWPNGVILGLDFSDTGAVCRMTLLVW
jgi:hypothetical protein